MKMSKRVPAAILSLIPMFIISLAVGLYLIPEGAGFVVDLLRILTIVFVPVGVFLLILLVNTKRRNAFQFFWFWLIMLPVSVIFLAIVSPSSVVEENENPQIESSDRDEPTEETETIPPETTPEDYMATCETISYETLARNPEKYAGNKYTFTGEVIQVVESRNTTAIRINVTPNELGSSTYYTDTIYATLEPKENGDRILEGDILVIYGKCEGLYSYRSVLGSEVYLPSIDVVYWDFVTPVE